MQSGEFGILEKTKKDGHRNSREEKTITMGTLSTILNNR